MSQCRWLARWHRQAQLTGQLLATLQAAGFTADAASRTTSIWSITGAQRGLRQLTPLATLGQFPHHGSQRCTPEQGNIRLPLCLLLLSRSSPC